MDDIESELRGRAEGRIGAVLRGKWRIQRLLGIGGMATVFAAIHRNGKKGAVKMLHRELSLDSEVRARFLREGYVANQVDHPGAVSVLDDDVDDDGSVFLVMELLEGETLDAVARSRPGERLDVGAVLAIADAVLDVLAVAHDKGIVHRDLKPENLFQTRRGELKVLDFGIARMRDATGGTSRRTRDGSQMGTPSFMPPEQALGNWDDVTARSDLWAIGATLFTLLTGRPVHVGGNVNQVLLEAMTKPAPKLGSVAPEIPPEVAVLIDRALEKEPNDRWEDARQMQRAVRDVASRVAAPEPRSSTREAETPESPEREAAEEPASSVQVSALPARTAPGVARDSADALPKPREGRASLFSGTSMRLVLGIGALVAALAVATVVTLVISPRNRVSQSTNASDAPAPPSPASQAPPVVAASSSATPIVEPGETPDAGSASSSPTLQGRAPLPPASLRPPSKPGPAADPLNRWR